MPAEFRHEFVQASPASKQHRTWRFIRSVVLKHKQQQKHPEGLLKCRLLGPAQHTAGSVGGGEAGKLASLSSASGMLKLLAQSSHFENHCFRIKRKSGYLLLFYFAQWRKSRGQSDAPRCLFSARETTEQRGPRPEPASSFSVSSRSSPAHVWAPWLCTRSPWELGTLGLEGD